MQLTLGIKQVFVMTLLLGANMSIAHAFIYQTTTTPDSRFELLDDEVKDLKTGLIWQRCSVGQEWSNTSCSGYQEEYTWTEALTSPLTLATADKPWRLPNIKELASIVERANRDPAINERIFLGTVSGSGFWQPTYWSSSPTVPSSYYSAWSIRFSDGSTTEESAHGFVRLVRDAE